MLHSGYQQSNIDIMCILSVIIALKETHLIQQNKVPENQADEFHSD